MKRFQIIMLVLTVVSCQERSLSKKEMLAILHERNEKLEEHFKSGNLDKLSMMYCDSAKLCADRADIYIGREAIKNFWKEASAGSKLLEMNTETLTVDGNADIIYETGRTSTKVLYKDSVYVSKVKFANVWKRQNDGTYLLDVDIWNSLPENN
jgi:ketosteroid isomerase-like protein